MKDKARLYLQKKTTIQEFIILHGIYYIFMTLLTLYGVFFFESSQSVVNFVTLLITIVSLLFIAVNFVMFYKMRYNNLVEILYLFIVVFVPLLLILYIRL